MNPYLATIFVPVLLSFLLGTRKKNKKRGVPVNVGGEHGYAIRNYRFEKPVESHWEGISTLAELFKQSCERYEYMPLFGSRKLIDVSDRQSFEKLPLGEYEWLTYGEAFKAVCNFASGLKKLGHGENERVAIFADTRAEWQIALQGCFRRSVSVVTIYSSMVGEALCRSLKETEVTTVVCGPKELTKLIDISGQLEMVKRVIYINEVHVSPEVSSAKNNSSWKLSSFEEVQKSGRENPVEPVMPHASDVAVIMYTSGSTGLPKGVKMTHRNVLATVSAVMTIVPRLGSKDKYLAYLPLAHILELAAESVMIAAGASIGYGTPLTLIDTPDNIKRGKKCDSSALKPTLMTAVPAILDRVRDCVCKNVDTKGGMAKTLFDISYQRRLAAINGSWFGAWGLEKLLWDLVVFKKVRAILGGHIRFLLSGGALLSGDTQRFINICLGAPIGQGYGLTETCAGGAFSECDDTSVGRVGAPLPCVYVKLVDWPEGGYLTTDSPMPRGEIYIGGPSVTLGYFNNEEETKKFFEVDERGMRWFHTGDIGRFHPDGCLEIIGQKKDIVKLQHGKYVFLGKVEAALSVSPYVDNIMVHADPSSSFCVALVVASHPALENWASKQGIIYSDIPSLCEKAEAIKEVQSSLDKAAKDAKLERFEIPSKIELLSDPWTPESGLVTAGLVTGTLKLKREVIKKQYADNLKRLNQAVTTSIA